MLQAFDLKYSPWEGIYEQCDDDGAEHGAAEVDAGQRVDAGRAGRELVHGRRRRGRVVAGRAGGAGAQVGAEVDAAQLQLLARDLLLVLAQHWKSKGINFESRSLQ